MLPKDSTKSGFCEDPLPSYQFEDGKPFIVTEQMKNEFSKEGCIIVRNLLTENEVKKLTSVLESPDSAVMAQAYDEADGEGRQLRLTLWNHPGSDITGMINRSEKVVNTCKELIGGDVYHYHTKIVMKDPRTGGAFQWHQDYGYWYLNGILFPDMVSCMIAIDKMDAENGALQVLVGSHRMGRIDHGTVGQQAGADIERVTEAEKLLDKHLVELGAGDALFFHCNVLHRSDQNRSDRKRWAMTACYNRVDNDPVKNHHHARLTPLDVVPNQAIMECKSVNDITGKWFINPRKSKLDFLPQNEGKLKKTN